MYWFRPDEAVVRELNVRQTVCRESSCQINPAKKGGPVFRRIKMEEKSLKFFEASEFHLIPSDDLDQREEGENTLCLSMF